MHFGSTSTETANVGHRMTTVEILYHMPDHPALLQSFVWQFHDVAPDYPNLRRFVDHWHRNVDAVLHSVRVGSVELVKGRRLKHARHEFLLH